MRGLQVSSRAREGSVDFVSVSVLMFPFFLFEYMEIDEQVGF